MNNKIPICCHPELIPTQWNQPKPEPCEMITCECGQNAYCPVCGCGWGSVPCGCDREEDEMLTSSRILPKLVEEAVSTPYDEKSWDEVLDNIFEEYSDAWEQLAEL